MAVSIAVAFIGIGLAWYFFISNPVCGRRGRCIGRPAPHSPAAQVLTSTSSTTR